MLRENNPLVSVLIPCYNASRYLGAVIESVLNQSYTHLEIILIDDGSTDHTAKIIQDYAGRDRRIVSVKNDQNLGLIRTLNKGVSLATGEFIARMDADDLAHQDRIKIQVEKLQSESNLDLVASAFWFMDSGDKVLGPVKPKALHSVPLKFVSLFRTPVLHPSIICKSSVLKSYQFDSGFLHSEDFELFSRMLFDGRKMENLTELLYYYRTSQQSVSVSSESRQIETHVKVSARNILRYFGSVPDDQILRVVCNRMNFMPDAKIMFRSFRAMDEYKQRFFEIEQVTSDDIREIESFMVYHKVDILLQCIKRQSLAGGIKLLPFLFSNIYLLFTSYGIGYLIEKIRFRY